MTERLAPTEHGILRAGALLASGKLVAVPTETVYGLAGDATSDSAVAAIFAAKGRPSFNPLIVHVGDFDAAERLAVFGAMARDLARRFWPGPLTLVLSRRADAPISHLATAGLDTIALRVPRSDLARRLIAAAGRPLAMPSANPSGKISATTAAHVLDGLEGRIAAVLDGGATALGLESTVVAVLDGKITLLRPGAVTRDEIGAVTDAETDDVIAPGQLKTHYAPDHRLRLNASSIEPGEALLAFGAVSLEGARHMLNLSPKGDLIEAAANLFAMLRKLDALEVSGIAAMQIPDWGLGEAINDRLRRAAHR